MTTQDEKALPTLQRRLEALAQRERKCPELGIILSFHSEMNWPCQQCGGSGKVPVLPGLRKPCPCTVIADYDYWFDLGGCPECRGGDRSSDPNIHSKKCHCFLAGTPGWVLRGDPATEDGQLLLFGVLCQALLMLVDEVKIYMAEPKTYVELCTAGVSLSTTAEGSTALEALVNAVTELKEGVPS